MYKGVGGVGWVVRAGGVGGGDGWVVGTGGQPEMGYSFQQDCLEVPCVQEVLIISPDKPGRPKRHLTNTGVNIRPISLIWFPPWAPLSQSWLHMVWKTSSRKADYSQLGLSMQQCTGNIWVWLSAGPIKCRFCKENRSIYLAIRIFLGHIYHSDL